MKRFTGILLAALFALPPAAGAGMVLKKESLDGKDVYRLDNGRLNLLVAPGFGGAVVSCRDRMGGDVELVPPRLPRGLCIDHFQAQRWPGEMYGVPYEVVAVAPGKDLSSLTLRYRVTGKWDNTTKARLRGLELVKTYAIRVGSPALECRVVLTAPAGTSKLFAFWQQNIFYAGGAYDRDADTGFRPSTRGIRVKTRDNNGHTGNEDWIRDFTAGWMALLDVHKKTGLVCLSQYDELDALYMNGGNVTLEPMYRRTFLPAGKSVEYINHLVPVAGLDNVLSATPDYVAGYTMTTDSRGKGNLALTVVRSVNNPAPVSFATRLVSVQALDQVKDVGVISFPAPGAAPESRRLAFTDVGPDPLVLRLTATVGGHRYPIEEYFNGTYKWGENIQTDMTSPVYRGHRPALEIKLQKPAKMAVRDLYGDQVWYIEGLLDDFYGMSRVLSMIRQQHDNTRRDRNFVSYSHTWLTRLDGFPWDYDDLLSYDMVIFGGAKREALGLAGVEMLADYLQAGGGMLVLGGPMAYGASHLAGTKLVEHWPVQVEDNPFGLVRVTDGRLEPVTDDAFLEHLDWAAAPRAVYVHKVKVKPWGRVVLTAGGKPFLVVGERGRQRVACILGAPIGSVGKGQIPFWEWSDWPYLMRQLSWYLMKDWNDQRFRKKEFGW